MQRMKQNEEKNTEYTKHKTAGSADRQAARAQF